MWRPEDEALLARLEEEAAVERLFRDRAGEAPLPSPRAAGLMRLARALPGGDAAVRSASDGDASRLAALLEPARLDGLAPALLHHLAVLAGQIADALATPSPEHAARMRALSIAAWLALGEERGYLRALATAVLAGSIDRGEALRAADGAALSAIEAAGRAAQGGAREQTREARAAMLALAGVEGACRVAGATGALRDRATRRAAALREAAADEALAPVLEGLAEASARGEAVAAAPALFEQAAAIWRWADEDEGVERFAVDQVTPIAWEIYRASDWTSLRRLLAPIEPLVDRLEARVATDPRQIAYAGPCAQVLVFRAEAEVDKERELALAERSVRACPTHRNGRLVLASALCDKASRVLGGSMFASGPREHDEAQAIVDRAERLFPASRRVPEVRAKIEEARKRSRWTSR